MMSGYQRQKPVTSLLARARIQMLPQVILALTLWLPFMTAINLADADSGIKVRLNVGIIRSAFTGLNFEDAEEAFKTFARTIGKQMGYDVEVTVHTFAHSSEVATIPEEQRPAIVILESWNYLDLADEAWLEPYFVSSSAGKVSR